MSAGGALSARVQLDTLSGGAPNQTEALQLPLNLKTVSAHTIKEINTIEDCK